jgi:hypothetical protein
MEEKIVFENVGVLKKLIFKEVIYKQRLRNTGLRLSVQVGISLPSHCVQSGPKAHPGPSPMGAGVNLSLGG